MTAVPKKDPYREKIVAPPFSTGGGGINFENKVQTSFVVLMLTNGFAPGLPSWPITRVQVQGKHHGYNVDDFIVTASNGTGTAKLLGQVKHDIAITNNNTFAEVIAAAWRDFNNAEVFDQSLDKIALVTGPLKGTDLEVREVLDWARNNSEADFFKQIQLARFSSNNKREKLKVIRTQVDKCAGTAVSDKKLWLFLKSFYLLSFDLDFRDGVNICLLRTLIHQYAPDKANGIWAQLVLEVQEKNQSAGEITLDDLPDEIVESFKALEVKSVPSEIKNEFKTVPTNHWKTTENVLAFCQAILVGKWSESNAEDIAFIELISQEGYKVWIKKVHGILIEDKDRISLKNKIWKVSNRNQQMLEFASVYLDEHINLFIDNVTNVLSEIDSQYELEKELRHAAGVWDKKLTHSNHIREALSESLAILANNTDAFEHCSAGHINTKVVLCIRQLFEEQNWQKWASLNLLLPNLSEAAPNEFMRAIEVLANCDTLTELFEQEGSGAFGSNQLTGVYWALEGLAWDNELLVRVVHLFGQLDSKDPGGQWSNRPLNSLVDIFLPWLPHNLSSLERQFTSIKALVRNNPETAFKLLIKLLPDQVSNTTGTYKPAWRNIIPDTWEKGISIDSFHQATNTFSMLLIETYGRDINKLKEIVKHLDKLPQDVLEALVANMSSFLPAQPDEIKRPIWEELMFLINRHRKFSDAAWSLPEEKILAIEGIANSIEPENLFEKGKRLFGNRDYDLYENVGDWDVQQKRLQEEREKLLAAIYADGGLDNLMLFCEQVEHADKVGLVFSELASDDDLAVIFPAFIELEGSTQFFVSRLAVNLYLKYTERALSQVDPASWTDKQVAKYFKYLPFVEPVWSKADELLGENSSMYWDDVSVMPLYEENIVNAASVLMKNNRPLAALDMLYMVRNKDENLPSDIVIQALEESTTSKEIPVSISSHQIMDFLKFLYKQDDLDMNALFSIEWAYLELFSKRGKSSPKAIQLKMESEPSFFCELISLVYKRKTPSEEGQEQEKEVSPGAAKRVWQLLYNWRVMPQFGGKDYQEGSFNTWISETLKIAEALDRYDVTLSVIGEALSTSPCDESGLWINTAIAEVLDIQDREGMRRGFATGIRNSRGVYTVDPSGDTERKIAEGYRDKAKALEEYGFVNLASTIRGVAESYEYDAEHANSHFPMES
jgi:hypothetical protein